MKSTAVVAEIIETGPNFVLVARNAPVALVGNVCWGNLVYTFLVSVQVIFGGETVRFGTLWDRTLEWLCMAKAMLPRSHWVVLRTHGWNKTAHLASDGFLETTSQSAY